jgi:hypothetical protein
MKNVYHRTTYFIGQYSRIESEVFSSLHATPIHLCVYNFFKIYLHLSWYMIVIEDID